MSAAVKIAILADASNAVAGMKATGRAADDMGDKASRSSKLFSGMGTALKGGLAVAGVAAFAALGSAMGDAFEGAQEAAKITRVLNNQIAALGPTGQKAFAGAADFADELGKQIAVDDDEIKKVQAKLASFPSAFKAGSLGADAMRRATQAAFDLQALGIGSAESNIVGIGKALDNPIKGMAALSKSGVSFTNEQKEQVKQYMAQGKLAEAQKIILAGIESNAKGAAQAAASPMQKLKVGFDNLLEGLALKLLPTVEKFGNFLLTQGLPAVERIVDAVGPKLSKAFNVAKSAAVVLYAALGNPIIQGVLATVLAITVAMKVYAAGVAVVAAATKAWGVATAIWSGITKAAAAAQAAFNFVMAMNPIGLVVIAVAALVAGLIVLYKRSEAARKIMDAVWKSIVTGAKAVWSGLKWLGTAAVSIWNNIVAGVRWMGNTVIGGIRYLVNSVIGVWRGIVGIYTYFVNLRNSVLSAVSGLVTGMVNRIRGAVTAFASIGSNIMNALGGAIERGKAWVRDKIASLANMLPDTVAKVLGIRSPSRVFMGLGEQVIAGLEKGLADVNSGIMNPALKAVLSGADKMQGALDGVGLSGVSMTAATIAPAAAGPTGAAPVTININVHADATTDPVAVGRKIAATLGTYVKATGRSVVVAP